MYRVLANTPLPDSEDGFLDDIHCYFPNLYDIKYMKHEFEELRGGLSRLGDILSLDRIGQQHQVGSDSWLTGLAYFKLIDTYLQGKELVGDYNGILYGLGDSVNDEQYLDNYTSKTEKLEREAREYQNMNDDYFHHEHYPNYSGYYAMSGPNRGTERARLRTTATRPTCCTHLRTCRTWVTDIRCHRTCTQGTGCRRTT